MVLTSPRAYNFNCAPNKKQSIFVLYTEWKKNAKFKSFFHFDRLFTKLKIIDVNGGGSLRLSRNYGAIDYAPGILAGIVKIMPTLLTNQMTGIFQWGI